MRSGWQRVGGSWYYLAPSGQMRTGWVKVGASWYYLGSSGAMVAGWLNERGSWYYLTADGAMLTGTHAVEGRRSVFSASGVWQGYADDAAAGLHEVMAAPRSSRSVVISKMAAAYEASGKRYPAQDLGRGGASTISAFAAIAYDEAVAEGVSPELLLAQVMKETGWLQYGGDVKIRQFNFGGLGATGGGSSGNSFSDVRTGLRAQVQHLRAYADGGATEASLAHPVVDTRFSYVRKGSAPYVEYLGTQENPARTGWAAAKGYGSDLVSMMRLCFG